MIRLEGRPFKGKDLARLKDFLHRMDLEYDQGIEYTLCILNEDYEIIGTGSVEENVLKCIAITPDIQGLGLSAAIVSELIQYEFNQGRAHLLMYTKPNNRDMFESLGFHTVLMTADILFMENRKHGFEQFCRRLIEETPDKALEFGSVNGAIVANCNPFTLGHRYLVEQALERCDYVHVLVLGDRRSCFGAEERFAMVEAGVRDLNHVILHKTSDYVVSAATFPTYFMKEISHTEKASCQLDLELFGKKIAPVLHITKRFVGTEPGCRITGMYNEMMMKMLPCHGICVDEIPRISQGDRAISASAVRRLMKDGNLEQAKKLVPETTWEYLYNKIQ